MMKRALIVVSFLALLFYIYPEDIFAGPGKVTELSCENVYPSTHPTNILLSEWAKLAERKSGGALKIKIFPGAQLVPAKEALDALSKGTIHMLVAAASYYSGKEPIGDILTPPVPGFKIYEDFLDIWYNTDFARIMNDIYRKKMNCFIVGTNFFLTEQLLMGKGKTVRTFDDLKGKKLRSPGGMDHEVIKALGAKPISTIAGEIYTAMQTGVLDGAIFPYYGLETYKLIEVVESITGPPLIPTLSIVLFMNQDTWNSLTPDLQKIIMDTQKERDPEIVKFSREYETKYERMARERGIPIYTFSDKDWEKVLQAVNAAWEWYLARTREDGKRLKDIVFTYYEKKYKK